MDEDTRFILRRLDAVEARLLKKIESLQAFKYKIVGISLMISFAVPLIIEVLFKRGN